MYAPLSFLCIFLSVGIVLGMDVEEKPTFAVLDGIRLAHQFYAKRDIDQKQDFCFSSLPDEIQGRITAQAHPRQTIDAYAADDLICVGEIKVPYKVCDFSVQHDSLVCVNKASSLSIYAANHIDLKKFSHNIVMCTVLNDDTKKRRLALCNDAILLQCQSDSLLSVVDPILTINKNGFHWWKLHNAAMKHVNFLDFACHSSLPLCVSIGVDRILRIHDVKTRELLYERDVSGLFGNAPDDLYSIAWHPTKPICAISKNGWIMVYGLNGLRNGSQNNFEGKPCFSYDGNKIWGQSNSKLKWFAGTNAYLCVQEIEKRNIHAKDIEIKEASIESVGDEYVLTRDNATHAFSLQSLHDDTNKEITSLNGLKGKLYRLPDNHDYRLFVIDEATDPNDAFPLQSIIKIYVPNSRARMEHYCLFNAALEAKKTDRAIDWNLFKNADQTLLQQTADHYPYFKKLMVDHALLK